MNLSNDKTLKVGLMNAHLQPPMLNLSLIDDLGCDIFASQFSFLEGQKLQMEFFPITINPTPNLKVYMRRARRGIVMAKLGPYYKDGKINNDFLESKKRQLESFLGKEVQLGQKNKFVCIRFLDSPLKLQKVQPFKKFYRRHGVMKALVDRLKDKIVNIK